MHTNTYLGQRLLFFPASNERQTGRIICAAMYILLRQHGISPYHTKIKDAARMICLAASFFAKCVNPVL